jgi:magnesium-transporting ATPase (P-type)
MTLIMCFSIAATRLKICHANDLALSGEDIDQMNPTDLQHAVTRAAVFYRVSPKHKLIIVKVNIRHIEGNSHS